MTYSRTLPGFVLVLGIAAAGTSAQGRCGATCEVQPGDTPHSIARTFGVSLGALLAEADGLDPLQLVAGDWLDIPDVEPQDLDVVGASNGDPKTR